MAARTFDCEVLEKRWLTESVVLLRFTTRKKIDFQPGQFLSIRVPSAISTRQVRRPYSFANPPEKAWKEGYELCIKIVPGGAGSTYVTALKKGDVFEASAPYGDFMLENLPNRSICFIGTGTGVAPFRSIALSEQFEEVRPKEVTCIFGYRLEKEVLFAGEFEKLGLRTINAVSQPGPDWTGFKGRVTDYLKTLPLDWNWHSTEFYLCGNGQMIQDVRKILTQAHTVDEASIHQEAFGGPIAAAVKKAS